MCISALVHTRYCAGKDSQPLSCSKKRRCSLLKAKIIQLVMKVCSVVNDWIRKSTVSPNQALLIAQRKDNQTQTNAPPRHQRQRASWSTPSHPSESRLAEEKKTPPALTLQVLSDNNLSWQPGGMRNKPTIWSQVFQFGETWSDSSLHPASHSFLRSLPPLTPNLTRYVHTSVSSCAVTHANRNTRSCGFQYLKAEIRSVWKELRDWSAAMYVWVKPGNCQGLQFGET